MKKVAHVLLFVVLAAAVLGVSYFVLMNGDILKTSVLYGYIPGTTQTSTSAPQIRAELVGGEPGFADGLLTHVGFQLVNFGTSPLSIYGAAFRLSLPTDFVVEGPLQRYGLFPVVQHDVNVGTTDTEVTFYGYSGTGFLYFMQGQPLVLAPGERRTVFTVGLRPNTGTGATAPIRSRNLVIELVQVEVEMGGTLGQQLAIDYRSPRNVPVFVYPAAKLNSDLNSDGRINDLDVQQVFQTWTPQAPQ